MSNIVVQEVPGAGERTFDRIPSENPARLQYALEPLLADFGPLRSYSWAHVQLDQGREGACTGFSATMEAAARPKPLWGDPNKVTFTTPQVQEIHHIARSVYYRARQLDIWPGENYEGSSVDGACLAGRELGWWDSWVWATGTPEQVADQVLRCIAYRGPVMAGSYWKEGMVADADGFMSYRGRALGGHAYLLSRTNVKRDAVWTPNSWGGAGQGWLRRGDLIAMAAEGADFALVNMRLRPKA